MVCNMFFIESIENLVVLIFTHISRIGIHLLVLLDGQSTVDFMKGEIVLPIFADYL